MFFWTQVATLIVVIVNQAIKFVIEQIVGLEKRDTTGGEQGSLAFKIFVAQFTNTAVLLIALRADTSLLAFIPGQKYGQANAEWYAKVLTPLVTTMTIQYIAPPASHFGKYFAFGVLRKILSKTAWTQNQLNIMHEDKELKVASSYGEVLVGMSVPLLYNSSLPILNWIAGFGFLLKYWADKWAVLRAYKKPPLYGEFTHIASLYPRTRFLLTFPKIPLQYN